MRKILLFFLLVFFWLISLSVGTSITQEVNAASCTFTVSPEPAFTNSTITITITNPGDSSPDGSDYSAVLRDKTDRDDLITRTNGTESGGHVVFTMNLSELSSADALHELVIQVRHYQSNGRPIDCTDPSGQEEYRLIISGPQTPGGCRIDISPSSSISASTEITYTIVNFSGPQGQYTIKVKGEGDSYPATSLYTIILPSGSTYRAPMGTGSHGTFSAELLDVNNNPVNPSCTSTRFSVTAEEREVGPPGKNPCEGGGCDTAFGRIPTNPKDFSSKILSIALGIAGGLAFILLIFGSIRILTSSGNQQSVQTGREIIIAAIAGLLFLIFSTLILRSLGVLIGLPF